MQLQWNVKIWTGIADRLWYTRILRYTRILPNCLSRVLQCLVCGAPPPPHTHTHTKQFNDCKMIIKVAGDVYLN
jgi:hypothetical protein